MAAVATCVANHSQHKHHQSGSNPHVWVYLLTTSVCICMPLISEAELYQDRQADSSILSANMHHLIHQVQGMKRFCLALKALSRACKRYDHEANGVVIRASLFNLLGLIVNDNLSDYPGVSWDLWRAPVLVCRRKKAIRLAKHTWISPLADTLLQMTSVHVEWCTLYITQVCYARTELMAVP